MRSYGRIAIVALALLASAGVANAGDDVAVTGAWVRPTLGQTMTSALYFTVVNGGTGADSLVSVEVAAAARAELHETTNVDGVIGMRPIAEMPLPPGAKVLFEPKGNHVMLMGLTQPLNAGDHLAAIFRFKTQAPVTVDAIVSMSAPQ